MSWGDAAHVDRLLTDLVWEKDLALRLGMSNTFNPTIPWVGAAQNAIERVLRDVILGRKPAWMKHFTPSLPQNIHNPSRGL